MQTIAWKTRFWKDNVSSGGRWILLLYIYCLSMFVWVQWTEELTVDMLLTRPGQPRLFILYNNNQQQRLNYIYDRE